MKKVLLFIAVALMSSGSFAQSNVMNKGDWMMNIGAGVSNGPGYQGYSYGFMPSFNFSMEVGLFPTGDVGIVTLGGIADVGFSSYDHYNGWRSKYFSTEVLFRGAWHLSVWNNTDWDVYAGVDTGIRFNSYSYDNSYADDYKDTDFVVGAFAGGRWMMKESFGLFAELATSEIAFAKFGVTFKF